MIRASTGAVKCDCCGELNSEPVAKDEGWELDDESGEALCPPCKREEASWAWRSDVAFLAR